MKEIKEERTKEKAQEVADKITPIFELIEALNEDDVDYLKATAKLIEEENSKLGAVAGVLVDYDEAKAKEQTGDQAVNRITGLILIWSAMKARKKIGEELFQAKIAQSNINKMFGL